MLNIQYYTILKLLRKEAKFTQSQVADRLGMKTSTYRSIENGHIVLKVTDLHQLSQLYSVEVAYILYGIKESESSENFRKMLLEKLFIKLLSDFDSKGLTFSETKRIIDEFANSQEQKGEY